jgi:hypothetical protein
MGGPCGPPTRVAHQGSNRKDRPAFILTCQVTPSPRTFDEDLRGNPVSLVMPGLLPLLVRYHRVLHTHHCQISRQVGCGHRVRMWTDPVRFELGVQRWRAVLSKE